MKDLKRELENMPYDKMFENANGQEELCHATGYEVCCGNPDVPGDWWDEYIDSLGDTHLGR